MVAMMFMSLSITIGLRVMLPIILTQIVYIPNNNTMHTNISLAEHVICPTKYAIIEDNNIDMSALIPVIIAKNKCVYHVITNQFIKKYRCFSSLTLKGNNGHKDYKGLSYHHFIVAQYFRKYLVRC